MPIHFAIEACPVSDPIQATGPFPVYVPAESSPTLSAVIRGSAIVGFPTERDPTIIHVFFEVNCYASDALRRFANRAAHAAGRCRWRQFDAEEWRREHPGDPQPPTEYGFVWYPTSAQARIPASDVVQVALYNDFTGTVLPISANHLVTPQAWIGSNHPEELLTAGTVFEQRRRISM
jgi:hypothetical protein